MGTISFSTSSKNAKPSDNFGFKNKNKMSETRNLFLYKKVKIDEPMNSNYGSPKFVVLETWKIKNMLECPRVSTKIKSKTLNIYFKLL